MKFVTTFQKLISTTKNCLSIKNEGNTFNLMSKNSFLMSIVCLSFFLILPIKLNALDTDIGKDLFKSHCASCHINGGNIIRRSKNLKISSLKHNGIDDPDSIAKIARQGIGIMDGYKDQLGDNGDQIVANWIWEQAQKAWIHE
tara:strand:- start:804 stop:1232 length:429 start_codon:yes stop_codon:yes gene_type:complete